MAKLVRLPTIHNVDWLLAEGGNCGRGLPDGRLVAARPISWQTAFSYDPVAIWLRLKVAWRVFIGELDALEWTGDQP